MADDKFRRQLAQVLDQWVSEGLIEPPQKDRIRDYYKLDDLARIASNRFTFVLFLLGAVLVGLGVITFIAANWIWIPRPVRAVGAVGIMVGCQWAGFRQWQTGSQRLGTLLLLIGEMAIGASIGLMAQWFQVSGSPSGLYLAWGIGVLAVAWFVRHTPSGILALFLLLVGGITDFERGTIFAFDPAVAPWLVVVCLMPLAYWCRSRWLLAQSIVLLGMALSGLGASLGTWSWWYGSDVERLPAFVTISLAHLAGIWGLWSLGLWHQDWLVWLRLRLHLSTVKDADMARDEDTGLDLAPTAQFLALLGLLVSLYFWSFGGAWADLLNSQTRTGVMGQIYVELGRTVEGWSLLLLLLGSFVLWALRLRRDWDPIRKHPTAALGMTHAIGLIPLLLIVLLSLGDLWVISAFVVNIALMGLGILLAWQGLQWAQRWRFWLGLLTMTGLVLTRFFEFPGDLLIKSLALVLAGVGVIYAGLKFETLVKARSGSGARL